MTKKLCLFAGDAMAYSSCISGILWVGAMLVTQVVGQFTGPDFFLTDWAANVLAPAFLAFLISTGLMFAFRYLFLKLGGYER